jgi:hypothetical protein
MAVFFIPPAFSLTNYKNSIIDMCSCNKRNGAIANLIATQKSIAAQRMVAAPTLPTVDTSIWGAPLWLVLHTLSLTATDKTLWLGIFNALKKDLPCPDCSNHYNEWARSNPLRFPVPPPSRQPFLPRFLKTAPPTQLPPVSDTISKWTMALHNAVNARRGTPAWSIDACRRTYNDRQAARVALASLDGVIGATLFSLLSSVLKE